MSAYASHKGLVKALVAAAILLVAAAIWFAAVSHLHARARPMFPTADAATAAMPGLPTLAAVQAATQRASGGAVKARSIFPGPDGLVGVVVESAADPSKLNVAWFTPHLLAVVVNGHLVSVDGGDLTQQAKYTQGLLLRPSQALAQTHRPAAHAVTIGTSGPVITAFFDPNCYYCHVLYTKLAPLAQAGTLRLRMVLVGVIKASSLPRAATILASKDPATAMAYDEDHFDVPSENGGLAVATPKAGSHAAQVLAQRLQVVEANTKLFSRTGASGTPAILYCSKSSRQIRMLSGVPRDIHTLLDDAAPASSCAP